MAFGDLFSGTLSGMQWWLTALVGAMLIEQVAPKRRAIPLRERMHGAYLFALGIAGYGFAAWPFQKIWEMIAPEHPFIIPLWDWLQPFGLAGYVAQIAVGLAVTDFFSYWRHRAEHRWFWRIHAVHHCPTELHAANDWGHPLGAVPQLLFVGIPLSLFQFSGPGAPTAVGTLFSILSIYIHSPVRLHFGWARRVVIDNRFHRIHHSTEPRHFDKNFGLSFSVWDALFGTAYWPEADEWPETGVAGLPPPETGVALLLMPFRRARRA